MEKARSFYKRYLHNSFFFCLVWAFLLNLIIETLARKGFQGLVFLLDSPIVFLYNTLIIFAMLVIATVFRRRIFFIVIVTLVWLGIGITNGIILIQRMTPFTVKDLSAITDGATLLTNYFSKTEIALIASGIIIGVIALVILFIKAPKKPKGEVNFKRNATAALLIILLTFGATFGLVKVGLLSTFFGNLAYAYEDYGVPYCFINTWLNTGIHKPMGYDEKKVKAIFDKSQYAEDGTMKPVQTDVDEDYPNILFLQLESFVDPMLFNNIKLSEDPIPYYRSLMKQYSSGSLTVPACGAGTANTEFEVMTGLSVKFFGPGEYPFKAVLKEKTAESIANNLKSMGYSTHAIHNHRALFYNRNLVFDNIGYDTFTSLEYMSDVPKTPKNWAKDSILTSQIMDALKSSKGHDYIYTISVQGHGKYPTEQLIKNPKIQVTDAPNEELKWKYEYYANLVYEMDQFVRELTETLARFDEDVILVMYGDHIPALDVTEGSYDAKNLYQTQYIVWSNFDMEKKDMDLTTYQLAAEVFDRIGIHTGTTVKFHQTVDHKSKDYLKDLKLLGYDMLYGKNYIYGGINPFEKAGMRMGVKTIKIDKVVSIGGKYYIKGQNFTEYSKVTLNGETLKTIYLGPSLLGLQEEVDPADAVNMKVSQIDKSNKEIISTTE
ncbi:LTA synthase family protein [Ihubacter sp. rT4E-8]|uniref:LTA synthase family protein n=1 Tax=Ihubacter sp. rT4E-8 TaxID=3242369 RepID=UPI003CF8EDCE